MKRREFITLLGGGAVAWPLTARAQQQRLPAIGSLHGASQAGNEDFMTAFRQGLKEAGYVEGENVTIEYRWANGSYDRQPSLMNELIDLRVNVIVTWDRQPSVPQRWCKTQVEVQRFPLYLRPEPTQSLMESSPA